MLANLAIQLLNVHAVTGTAILLKSALAVSATGWLVHHIRPSLNAVLVPCRILARNSDSVPPSSYR